jgi:outer membrane protein assembly factor BamB
LAKSCERFDFDISGVGIVKRKSLVLGLCTGLVLVAWSAIHAAGVDANPDWPQWGRTWLHTSAISAAGQSPQAQLANITYDPFVPQEKAETGNELLAHYQVPLVDGNLVFMEFKTGTYVSCDPPGSGQPYPCGPDDWNTEIWNERAFTWKNGALVELWNFQTDWKPEPNTDVGGMNQDGLFGWEPVFHAALWGGYVFVPGVGGTIYKLNEWDGSLVKQYNAFGGKIDQNRFVSGPLTVDAQGNVYYNAIALDPTNPWSADIRGAWLVKVGPDGAMQAASYATLAPPSCSGCGSQRPGINLSPAASADGKTVYTGSTAHFDAADAYLLAVNSDLAPQWQSSLTVDNGKIRGTIIDLSSATPVVLPDGSVLYGVLGRTDRGHMLKFSSSGQYLAEFDFGWDDTPAVYTHDGTYSVITKDNHYDTGGPYYISQLNADLAIEWKYQSVDNFEWCVNAPAVDKNGTVYADSEDGNVYVINQGGTLKGKLFLQSAVGAAYTPIALGRDGKIYTENDGNMFVVGNSPAK